MANRNGCTYKRKGKGRGTAKFVGRFVCKREKDNGDNRCALQRKKTAGNAAANEAKKNNSEASRDEVIMLRSGLLKEKI